MSYYSLREHEFEARPLWSECMVCVKCGFQTSYATLRRIDFEEKIPICKGEE